MAQICLYFEEYQFGPELSAVCFKHPLLPESRKSYRGKGISFDLCRFNFQWSPAVRAMSILFLRTKARDFDTCCWPSTPLAAIGGSAGSAAASLDYAISKKPLWLLDMFGTDENGGALARNIFSRWNSERKRGGDVFIAVNPRQLRCEEIHIYNNNQELHGEDYRRLMNSLELTRSPRSSLTHTPLPAYIGR